MPRADCYRQTRQHRHKEKTPLRDPEIPPLRDPEIRRVLGSAAAGKHPMISIPQPISGFRSAI
ncbi:hypothetical protein GFL88_02935 [Rhizobium leguminosarum bv. viciae]|nr:hypothetical protein [Rhizobium leguminosarum bv. viciae]